MFGRLVTVVFAALAMIAIGSQALAATKVGFVLSTLQEERYQKDQKFFIDEAKKLGLEPIVVAADNNAQTQTAKVENLLSQGVKVLVIQAVNSNAAANLVTMAHQDKVPVVAYDRFITNAPVDAYITVNAVQIGALQAEAAVKATGGKGNFVILKGQAGHSIVGEHMKGINSVLSKHPNIKVVVEKFHDQWSPALAMTTTENALSQYKNDVAAVIANNSGMANGAVQALAAQKLTGKVFVAGSDADLTAIKNIVAGRQQFEVMFDIEGLARKAAQVAAQLAKGEKPKADQTTDSGTFKVPTIATPVLAVTKDNLEERIFKTGFHAKSAVMGK